MSDEVTRYPLHWPLGFSRTPAGERKRANFAKRTREAGKSYSTTRAVTVSEGVKRVQNELCRFSKLGKPWRTGWDPRDCGCIISTNIQVRLDGLPRSDRGEPADPGVAVYFELDDKDLVLCCDKWDRVADNLAAIAATLDAMRGLERWGVTEVSRAFDGFAQLPAPGESTAAQTCWTVLGIQPSATYRPDDIEKAFRTRAMTCHPDRPGGSHEAFTALQSAKEEALLHAIH